jgi:predicted nucleic acid-binding Zn ribbon protein
MSAADDRARTRSRLPRPLREILNPAVQGLEASDQARAYGAWAAAAGAEINRCARPSSFFKGVLTVECASSIWTNELNYLARGILERMEDIAPGHPVRSLRFVVERASRAQDEEQEESAVTRVDAIDAAALGAARRRLTDISDERLRAAMEAVLRSASDGQRG